MKPEDFIVADDEGKVIGTVRVLTLGDGVFELASLAVDPIYRGAGVGSRLVQHILVKHVGRPIYVLCLPSRKHFYEENGFVQITYAELPHILKNEYDRMMGYPDSKANGILLMIRR